MRPAASYLQVIANCMLGLIGLFLSFCCFPVVARGQTTGSLGPAPGKLIDVYGHKTDDAKAVADAISEVVKAVQHHTRLAK